MADAQRQANPREDPMATYNQNGRDALLDENRSSWRPDDQRSSPGRYHGNEDDRDLRSFRDRNQDRGGDRDPRRWEGSRGSELGYHDDRDSFGRSTEYYGQGQSGYSAGRHGGDRSQRGQNRNEMISSPGRFEDPQSFGIDDRFTGRGGRGGSGGYWEDQRSYDPERYGVPGGYGGGRGFESDRSGWRGNDERMGYQRGFGPGGYGQNMGYQSSYQPGYRQTIGYQGGYGQGGYGPGGYRQNMSYQGGFAAGGYHDGGLAYGPGGYGPGSQGGYGPGAGDGRTSGYGPNMGYAGDDGFGGDGGYGSYGMRGESQRYRESHRHRGDGPHRGKGPVGYQRSDERLREMISESLADDDQIDASQIEVTVNNGEVTLVGTVEDRRSKRDAEECACSVSGVRDVQNQLRVKDERKGERGDERQAGKPSAASPSSYAGGKAEAETFSQDKKPRA
jgi:hypothetical protein